MKSGSQSTVVFIRSLFEDSRYFLSKAHNEMDLQGIQRYLRASVLCVWAAFEGWINKTCYDFARTSKELNMLEKGFLLEKRVAMKGGEFQLENTDKYESTEVKLEFLLRRFAAHKLNKSDVRWQRFQEAKNLRDRIVHCKMGNPPVLTIKTVENSVSSITDYLSLLSKKIYKSDLRL